ncbi:hypothetical protein ACQKIY_25030 [Bacillus mycoides]|uniref:hypothetical protein n=1 Tax=Bacillus mycoides TaxID=1405 RepID=UPI003D03DEE1
MKIIPVLAPSYQEFRYFVQDNQLKFQQFAYITTEDSLRGYGGIVIVLPNWKRNDKYDVNFRRRLIEMEVLKRIFLARHVEI